MAEVERTRKRKRTIERTTRDLIVKFHEGRGNALFTIGNDLVAVGFDLEEFKQVLNGTEHKIARQSFPRFSQRLRALQALGTGDVSLDLFVRVILTLDESTNPSIAGSFQALQEVQYAVLAGMTAFPPSNGTGSSTVAAQDYVFDAEGHGGISAAFAWSLGIAGGGVRVCLVDEGYRPLHPELVDVIEDLRIVTTAEEDHGTKAAGILFSLSEAPSVGITGIAHRSKAYFSSHVSTPTDVEGVVKALDAAFGLSVGTGPLTAGDVVVLEHQVETPASATVYFPSEWDADVRRAIGGASRELGITTVAAAGNARDGNNGTDLNAVMAPDIASGVPVRVWNFEGNPLNDSHAIIVGAGNSFYAGNGRRRRKKESNFGGRLDSQGWGDSVLTCGLIAYERTVDGRQYDGGYDSFDGTSSATAIVGGAVAVIQSAVLMAMGPLTPLDIRQRLRNPSLNTPQRNAVGGDVLAPAAGVEWIGPLPDLRKQLRLLADVYMRDNLDDDGSVPSAGLVFWSPDIIVSQAALSPEEAWERFGQTWSQGDLGDPLVQGAPNNIYFRLSNRGSVASQARVHFYWSDASTFLYPSDWNFVGTFDVGMVGGSPKLAGPFPWPPGAPFPTDPHPCLIARVETGYETVLFPAGGFASSTEYAEFLASQNNLVHRNVQRIIITRSSPIGVEPAMFRVRGPSSGDDPGEWLMLSRLEIDGNLPSSALLRVDLGDQVVGPPSTVRFPAAGGPLIFTRIGVPAGERAIVRVAVENREEIEPGTYQVHASQFLGAQLLGRVNLEFQFGKDAPR